MAAKTAKFGPPRAGRDPFEVKLTPDQEKELAQELSIDIDDAESARMSIVGADQDIDQWHKTYEGGDKNLSKDTPWPGAANLTSYIGTEKVDALRSRIMNTIFVDPVWLVEGWGESAAKAPFVEQYHQWKVEEERLQGILARVIHNSLIEGTGVLEVAERAEWRKIRARMQVGIMSDPMTGQPIMDEMGLPRFVRDPDGRLVETNDDDMASSEVLVERMVRMRRGPQYRVVPLTDFLVLPGHAHDKSEVWAYAKKFFRRMGQLREREVQGFYKNVEQLGEDSERDPRPDETRRGQAIAAQLGERSEKELWEMAFLKDLDGDGVEEWYLATVSRNKRELLRLQRDDVGMHRYLLYTPFPRSNSIYGYSFIGHKLGSVIDEHTGIRNAIADRSALVNSAPVVRVQGALWDPYEQPFGPRSVIDVRSKDEVTTLQFPDVPGSMVERERTALAASERISGLNDATLGVSPQATRTLGEFENTVQQSMIRIDEAVRHIQETNEELFQVRHQIYQRNAREGMVEELPESLLAAAEQRGFTVPGGPITAELLNGIFRGIPHGSLDTANMAAQRSDFVGFMQGLAQLTQAVPGLQMMMGTPQVAKTLLTQAMRVFRWKDKEGLLGMPLEQWQPQPPPMMLPPAPPGALGPGMPPGEQQ